ncbi:flagellar basal body protein [Phenylobacterium deserti]|uniref:Flagellar basal body protein n=1 Tax=Phenylobacterium deserti TaxID=1914756 RepID=A0A328ACF5_9CAUL|nr:flagellar basal body protein [Phenylobacterium deserti]RAK52341.1 flagellar basal body protein [Phenylobacterium deserti]
MALVVNDAADRVDQMILLTERLTELVAAGARCFEERRPQDAMAFHEETARLANIYRHESTRVRANPGLVSSAPSDQRQKLIRATEAFHAVLDRQGRAIDAARTVTEGLVKTIAEEVANQREQRSGYGPGALPPASAARGATAITLNQRA